MAGTEQRMFAAPPADRTAAPLQPEPTVHVSWPELFLLRLIPKRYADGYLIWRFYKQLAKQRRDPNAPCPACGNREGNEMRWAESFEWPDRERGALLHGCKLCKATWGEKALVPFEQWKVTLSTYQERSLFDEVRRSA
jgi:hypothetical protein